MEQDFSNRSLNVSARFVMLLVFMSYMLFMGCGQESGEPPKASQFEVHSTQLQHTNGDTLPNGKLLYDLTDSFMYFNYREAVGTQKLSGGYSLCYGVDQDSQYFYLRHGDSLHLLNKTEASDTKIYLGELEEDHKDFFITRLFQGSGGGPAATFQVFDKRTGRNLLGEGVEARDFKHLGDTVFFLYDHHSRTFDGYLGRMPADSIFLFNSVTKRSEVYQLTTPIDVDEDYEITGITNKVLNTAARNLWTEKRREEIFIRTQNLR